MTTCEACGSTGKIWSTKWGRLCSGCLVKKVEAESKPKKPEVTTSPESSYTVWISAHQAISIPPGVTEDQLKAIADNYRVPVEILKRRRQQ